MKNTAIGNHAGPVGSITTSKRVPAGVPSNALNSIADKLSTVGNAFRFASVLPSSSRTRTACADAIPKSIPTNRLQLIVFSLKRNGATPTRPNSNAHFSHGPNVEPPNRGSHTCAANGPDLQGPAHFPHPGHPWPGRM